MRLTRRIFMRGGAMAVIGSTMVPALFTRAVLAQTEGLRRGGKRLVVVFQRGAADGLNTVIPYREASYYQMRSTIAVPQAQILDLDGTFGLHPAMASLKPLWDAKELAVIHACGSPDPSRSHFDAQDYMESGTPGIKSDPGRLAQPCACCFARVRSTQRLPGDLDGNHHSAHAGGQHSIDRRRQGAGFWRTRCRR